ncbi:MAG: TonB-dependent receptor [Flavobacteriaceae bacterium]|nr:TonB-dependent receptor [Flavobacteriaceae bacterium]
MKKFLWLIPALIISFQVYSQKSASKVTVSGRILDSITSSPVEFATISFKNSSGALTGTTSDPGGNFSMDLQPDVYDIQVEFLSYKPVVLSQRSIKQDTDLGTIRLSYTAEELKEIQLVARKDLIEYGVNKKIYNASRDIANFGGNALDVLNNAPAVRVDENGNVILRGTVARVLIDGKPVFGLDSGTDILKSIPSTTIDKVEIITASAKYGAEGGGILNIITKKRKSEGINGSLDLHAGIPDNNGGSFFVNESAEKINLYSTISFDNERKIFRQLLDQQAENNNSVSSLNYHQDRTDYQQRNSLLFTIGSDFILNKNNTLTTSILVNSNDKNYVSQINSNDLDTANNTIQSTNRHVDDLEDISRIEGFINYTSKFRKEGHQLSVDLKYVSSASKSKIFINEEQLLLNDQLMLEKGYKDQDLDNFLMKADYTLPLNEKDNVELGHESTLRFYRNSFKANQFDLATSDFTVFTSDNDKINYKEKVYAFYGQFNHAGEKLTYTLGLRSELSDISIGNSVSNNAVSKKYNDLFPFISFSYAINDISNLSLDYRRSIVRPELAQINPYLSITDNRFVTVGNPELNPFYRNYFELLYDINFEKVSILSSIFLNYADNQIMTVIEYLGKNDEGLDVYQRKPRNDGQKNITGMDLDFTYTPNKTLMFNSYISPFLIQIANTKDHLYDIKNITWHIESRAILSLNNGLRFSLSHLYQSPVKSKLVTYEPMNYFDAAVSKKILQDKASLTFRVLDIFNNKWGKYKSFEADIYSYRRLKYDPQFTLSFTYNFNQTRKSSKDRSKEVKTRLFDDTQDERF